MYETFSRSSVRRSVRPSVCLSLCLPICHPDVQKRGVEHDDFFLGFLVGPTTIYRPVKFNGRLRE